MSISLILAGTLRSKRYVNELFKNKIFPKKIIFYSKSKDKEFLKKIEKFNIKFKFFYIKDINKIPPRVRVIRVITVNNIPPRTPSAANDRVFSSLRYLH